MKNITTIITNLLSNKPAANSSASNATEVLPVFFTPEAKRVAFLANAVLFLFLSLLLTSDQAKAASFTVNLNTDVIDANIGDGVCDSNSGAAGAQCTLRAAIQEANALAGIDNISFALPLPSTIDLTIGELLVTGSVSINGPGARALSVERVAGAPNFRIFSINAPNSSVAISDMSIVGGKFGGAGAGIQNNPASSSLNLTGVTVRNNLSTVGSGGIQNNGTLNITRSTISNNTGLRGGGISNNTNGIMNITNSTVSGNIAVSESQFLAEGGGIVGDGTVTLTNVTVSGNAVSSSSGNGKGGGLYSVSNFNTFNLRNTIVAGNTAPGGSTNGPDVNGQFISQGNNLIGIGDSASGFSSGVKNDKFGSGSTPLNAQLGALQSNGGQTDTHALLAGSPAIDAGNNCVADPVPTSCLNTPLITDQRGTGFARRVDGNSDGTATVDIGAFEVQLAPTAAQVVAGGRIFTDDGRGIRNVRVTVTFSSGETFTTVSGESGFYEFADLPASETYIFTVSAKHYTFAQDTQVRSIKEEVQDIDFIGESLKKKKSSH